MRVLTLINVNLKTDLCLINAHESQHIRECLINVSD